MPWRSTSGGARCWKFGESPNPHQLAREENGQERELSNQDKFLIGGIVNDHNSQSILEETMSENEAHEVPGYPMRMYWRNLDPSWRTDAPKPCEPPPERFPHHVFPDSGHGKGKKHSCESPKHNHKRKHETSPTLSRKKRNFN